MRIRDYIKSKRDDYRNDYDKGISFELYFNKVDKEDKSIPDTLNIIDLFFKLVLGLSPIIYAMITFISKMDSYKVDEYINIYFGVPIDYSFDLAFFRITGKLIFWCMGLILIIVPFIIKLAFGKVSLGKYLEIGISILSSGILSFVVIMIINEVFSFIDSSTASNNFGLILFTLIMFFFVKKYIKFFNDLFHDDKSSISLKLDSFRRKNREIGTFINIIMIIVVIFAFMNSKFYRKGSNFFKTTYEIIQLGNVDEKTKLVEVLIYKDKSTAVAMDGYMDQYNNLKLTKNNYKYIDLIDKKMTLIDVNEIKIEDSKNKKITTIIPAKKEISEEKLDKTKN